MASDYSSLVPNIKEALPKLDSLNAMLGFDGTVDVICKPVESRQGLGDQFTPFQRIWDFGQRVIDADGKSAMIEILNELEKIGGDINLNSGDKPSIINAPDWGLWLMVADLPHGGI